MLCSSLFNFLINSHSCTVYIYPHSHTIHSGELWHEPSGKLYKGGFRKGKFHGKGELLWFADCEDRKKYIGDFSKGSMNGQGEMK